MSRSGDAGLRHGLQMRYELLVLVGMLGPLALVAWLGWDSLDGLSRELVAERQARARATADRIEDALRHDLEALSAAASAGRGGAPAALRSAYSKSRLLASVFLLDERGEPLWQDPPGPAVAAAGMAAVVGEARRTARPAVSDLVEEPRGRRRIYIVLPLVDWQGSPTAIAGGVIDADGPALAPLLIPAPGTGARTRPAADRSPDSAATIDLRDGRGVVIASSHRGSVAARTGLGETVAPLSLVPWTVSVTHAEGPAPLSTLSRRLAWLLPPAAGLALLFAWGAARSVMRPLAVLTGAAERIAAGELSVPVPPLPEDEVGRLGRSLESMREALAASLASIRKTNEGLETRVAERTAELQALALEIQDREARRASLLKKLISAHEDERKRIARELHDETCQTVAALAVGLEMASSGAPPEVRTRLDDLKALTSRALNGLRRLIFDLRPSVLDDLGLFPAIRWYASENLARRGVAVRCELDGPEHRLPAPVETAIFRVVQESLTNVIRHAHAEAVLIQVGEKDGALTVEIEDDGEGFDLASVAKPEASGRGLGLLGMRERAEILGGSLAVDSAPGRGTRVLLTVPLEREAHA